MSISMSDLGAVDRKKFDPAEPFARTAELIRANAGVEFGGAFVIQPPDGEAVKLVLLNARQQAAVFWGLLKTQAEIALAELQAAERQRQGRGY